MSSSRRRPNRFVPELETLSDRICPAGALTTTFTKNILTITAINDANPSLNNQNIALLGAGSGHVSISVQDGETIQGKNSFNKVKQVIAKMGEGNDTVTLVDLRINKSGTMVKYQGGDGDNNLFYDGTRIDIFNLSVTSGVGNFVMAPTAPVKSHFVNIDINCPDAVSDIILGGMVVDGTTKVVLGSGADVFQMDDNTHNGSFSLNTAGGIDTVTIGHLDQDDGEELIFEGTVNIKLGAGNDTFIAGVTVHDPGMDDLEKDFTRFRGNVFLDGGDDTDTIDVFHPRSTEFTDDDNPNLDNWEVIVYNP